MCWNTRRAAFKLDGCPGRRTHSFTINWLSKPKSFMESEFWQFHQVMLFHLSYLFTAIYRNAFQSNPTVCHQFRGNSALVNAGDGRGDVSITAGLVLNELRMYLHSAFVCAHECVVPVYECWRATAAQITARMQHICRVCLDLRQMCDDKWTESQTTTCN